MALSTYAELKAAIGTQSGRDDQSALAGDDVAAGEARIARKLRCRRMIVRTSASVDGEFTSLPSDFLGMAGVRLTSTTRPKPLKFLPIDGMHEVDTGESGEPTWYGVSGNSLRLLPVPDESYTAELTYYARVPTLSDEAPTNWLLTAAPDLYLYAALLAFGQRLEDPRAQDWERLFLTCVAELQDADQLDALGETLTPRTTFAP